MRITLAILLSCLLVTLAHAETTGLRGPQDHLGDFPKPPGSGCQVTGDVQDAFRTKFFEAEKALEDEIRSRRRSIKKWQESNSRAMQEKAVDMPGFEGKSQAEMKKMSKAEKRKMAEQMMAEKFGVTPQELKDQKKANASGDVQANVAWAKAMSGEMQVNDMMKSKGEREAGQKKITDLQSLTAEQADLMKRTTALRTETQRRVVELEATPEAVELKKKVEQEKRELEGMITAFAPCKKLDDKKQLLLRAQQAYCSYMSPRYLKILENYKASIIDSLTAHRRLDEVSGEIQLAQVGVGLPPEALGLSGLETVQDYSRYLAKAFQYNDRDPSKPVGSYCDGEAGTISK